MALPNPCLESGSLLPAVNRHDDSVTLLDINP